MLNNVAAILGSGVVAPVGDYESIQTAIVGSGGTTSITFTPIGSTYKHLQIRWLANTPADFLIRFNSDSGSNYSSHYLFGSGSGSGATGALTPSTSAGYIGYGAFASPNGFSGGVTDILDYANTSKYKTVKTLMGVDGNGSGGVMLASSLWMSTSAITSITIFPQSSQSLAQYSHFALYGIKG